MGTKQPKPEADLSSVAAPDPDPKPTPKRGLGRRGFLHAAGVGAASLAFPYVFIPRSARAETIGRGTAKHLVYIRLAGGFRFPTAFNAAVAPEFNPFGEASGTASGTDWGVGSILAADGWRDDALRGLGLRSIGEMSNEICVIPCVDHEPLSGSADGNHQSGLVRFLTGEADGATGLFTMINYGLRERVEQATAEGITLLPAVIMGDPGMGRGAGPYAAYRPPLMRGDDLGQFGFSADALLPDWAKTMTAEYDLRNRDRQIVPHRPTVDAYLQSREATKAYADIFSSDPLDIGSGSAELHDGISNAELEQIFGDDGTARNIRLALRLFSYGCPAVYLDQGGYDYHSNEEGQLPGRIQDLSRLISGLEFALKKMQHPEGGTYWDHTVVAIGSEFSRTARGGRFNSGRGSDHGGDLSTRWMSMPFFGGPIIAAGQAIGRTRSDDLEALSTVFSYRSVMKTLFDALGADHSEFFPADEPFDDLFS